MPDELEEALIVESLAQRYHCTPAEILAHPVWLLNHVQVIEMGRAPSDG